MITEKINHFIYFVFITVFLPRQQIYHAVFNGIGDPSLSMTFFVDRYELLVVRDPRSVSLFPIFFSIFLVYHRVEMKKVECGV